MSVEPRFAAGDRVQIDTRAVFGHCRTPYYLRGTTGVVEAVLGRFKNPELLAYHKPGVPKRFLYRVRFSQRDLWTDYNGPAADILQADIFEHWLADSVSAEGKD
jgi:hypothetical protein